MNTCAVSATCWRCVSLECAVVVYSQDADRRDMRDRVEHLPSQCYLFAVCERQLLGEGVRQHINVEFMIDGMLHAVS